jgi:hypothetical protein
MDVKVGDKSSTRSTAARKVEAEEYLILSARDVLAVIGSEESVAAAKLLKFDEAREPSRPEWTSSPTSCP